MAALCAAGIDLGTSGCRAVAIDRGGGVLAEAAVALPPPERPAPGYSEQTPALWWQAVQRVLADLSEGLRDCPIGALAVDGTSSTLLLCDPSGTPLAPALMYDDARSRAEAARIARLAPPDSPARGASASLAKVLYLLGTLQPRGRVLALHQADWVLGQLCGRFGVSDWNNALKLGYEPAAERWEPWLWGLGFDPSLLPQVLPPGCAVAGLRPELARGYGWAEEVLICTGTTDSTAAVMAAGAAEAGDAVTSLGSTLVVKLLSERPIADAEHGVYSHRLGDRWLVGGASNSGGGVLRAFFSESEIDDLSRQLRPEEPTGLDYYPLRAPGERFPRNHPDLQPRLQPRPAEDWRFFQGLLEGIARIEAEGYTLLGRLGAPAPTRIYSLGGGAKNAGWTRIRERALGVPLWPARHPQAAYGTALLALRGLAGTAA